MFIIDKESANRYAKFAWKTGISLEEASRAFLVLSKTISEMNIGIKSSNLLGAETPERTENSNEK